MPTHPESAEWLSSRRSISLAMLAELSGQPEIALHELVEVGVLSPAEPASDHWHFSIDCVVTVRRAARLRHELELDSHALALALLLMEQIDGLENELRALRARLPGYPG
jgi:chaperone modulatory protein CbpM